MFSIILFLFSLFGTAEQVHPSVQYASPVHDSIFLAGNFGEPRMHHFHGGLDIKTRGVTGKPVFSVAEGYVSQVTIGLYGFGNAVYVTHPDGNTSVYCHLKSFAPHVKALLLQEQYRRHTSVGAFRFRPNALHVAKGQLIAISGNTGFSTAPHLHLEIQDTRTQDKLDPFPFIASEIEDTIPPRAHFFMAQPQEGASFNHSATRQVVAFTAHSLPTLFTAWGKVGFSLWGNDYMQGTFNHLGIRQIELLVDGNVVFSSTLDRVPFADNAKVNAWGNLDHYRRSFVWYLRSYMPPFFSLPFVQTDDQRGIVDFSEERTYQLSYRLTDAKGNLSVYSFTVEAHPYPSAHKSVSPARQLLPTAAHFSGSDYQLVVNPLSVAEPIDFSVREEVGNYSTNLTLEALPYQLFQYASLRLKLHAGGERPEKFYMVEHLNKDKYLDSDYKNGWLMASVRQLGATYRIERDVKSPSIVPVSESLWRASRVILINISDKESDIGQVEAFIDGRFFLLEKQDNSTLYRGNLNWSPIVPTNSRHRLKIVATDHCHNRAEYNTTVEY